MTPTVEVGSYYFFSSYLHNSTNQTNGCCCPHCCCSRCNCPNLGSSCTDSSCSDSGCRTIVTPHCIDSAVAAEDSLIELLDSSSVNDCKSLSISTKSGMKSANKPLDTAPTS